MDKYHPNGFFKKVNESSYNSCHHITHPSSIWWTCSILCPKSICNMYCHSCWLIDFVGILFRLILFLINKHDLTINSMNFNLFYSERINFNKDYLFCYDIYYFGIPSDNSNNKFESYHVFWGNNQKQLAKFGSDFWQKNVGQIKQL